MTAQQKRQAVIDKYREIIGRNVYSQTLRDYCYKKYKDGKYYSDCSSSVSYAYKEAGFSFGILNTVGMYNGAKNGKFMIVPVVIEKGQIQNPEVMRLADLLLYAGSDNSRPGCVGHVELYIGIQGGKHYLFGHGSGNPKKTEMTSKNKSRYNSKTSTKVGNKGLIMVIRFIQDDEPAPDPKPEPDPKPIPSGKTRKVKSGTWYIRSGPGKEYDAIGGVKGGSTVQMVEVDGWSYINDGNMSGWVSNNALEEE